MIRRPPRSTRTDTLLPYTTLFRSTEGGQATLTEIECGHGHQRRHERFNLLQSAVIGNQRPDIYQAIIHSRLRPDARRFNPVPGPEFQCVTPVPAAIERSPDVRSEERRVGKGWFSTFKSRWAPYP